MLRVFLLIILLTWQVGSVYSREDSLEIHSDFKYTKFQMQPDYEGEVVVTLIEPVRQPDNNHAVLYIHGFNDYFFQEHMADSITSWGVRFYALDLRKYGRSFLPHQKFNNVRDLSEYYADIDTALAYIQSCGVEQVSLLGHSTGGLVAALYAHANPNQPLVKALALNSPFLDMNLGWFLERMVVPVVAAVGRKHPDKEVAVDFPAHYGHSLHCKAKGQWCYDLSLKPHVAPRVNCGWIRAIYLGQQSVKRRLKIRQPILVMHSDASCDGMTWSDDFYSSDAVLDVEDIEKYAFYLGNRVVTRTIAGGIHDLALSGNKPVKEYFMVLQYWLNKHFL